MEPPRARGGASGGIFAYWFGTSSLRADPSEVFAGLVYRLRARDAAFAPHELALLKQCETDVQVRAVTAGYVTGAGTHSALGFVSKRAPRLMLSVLAGACGAYAGVQSMARDCMRRVARLEDSRLAADARFVIRQVAPHDPLGREPAGGEGEARRQRARDANVRETSDVRETGGARGDGASATTARLEMEETATASSARATSETRPYGDDATRSGDAMRRDKVSAGDGDGGDEVGQTRVASFIPRDAFGEGIPGNEPGNTSASKRIPRPPRGGARSRAEAREARRARPARRRARGVRGREKRRADENHAFAATEGSDAGERRADRPGHARLVRPGHQTHGLRGRAGPLTGGRCPREDARDLGGRGQQDAGGGLMGCVFGYFTFRV